MSVRVSQGIDEATISIVVTRADGRVEDYGVVAAYYRSPLRRLWYAVRRRLARRPPERG